MGDKQPRQQVSGTPTGRSAASQAALQNPTSVQHRQGKTRSTATGRFLTKATPTVGIKRVKRKPIGSKVQKTAAKSSGPSATAPADATPLAKAVLTGRTGLVGFFRSSQGDLSETVKDLARGRDRGGK